MRKHLEIAKILGRVLLCLRISYGYDNLSTGRTSFTWMSSIFHDIYSPSFAVDGEFDKLTVPQNSCAISQNRYSEATWRIDLGDVRSVKNVQIYYRNDEPSNWDGTYRGRFAGFFLYASNTTSKEDGYLCYHTLQNGTNSPQPIFTVPCVAHARYIIYYNERISSFTYPSYYSNTAYIELCEVVILGCEQSGVYGASCNLTCPFNCQEKRCWIDNGTCLGCADGYKGIRCDTSCPDQHYGQECKKTCGNCLDKVSCHHVSGSCVNGCSAGWKLDKCVMPCGDMEYGRNCSLKCGLCRDNRTCNRISGHCDNECMTGFQPPYCNRKCDAGKYGEDCRLECGHCKNEEACDHVTGECINGCSPGYLTAFCNDSCAPGNYGEHCVQNCSGHCASCLPCNVANGHCDNGCDSDWQGDRCDVRSLRMLTEQCDSMFVTGLLSGAGIVIAVNFLGMAGFLFRRHRKGRTNKGKRSQNTTGRQTTYVNEVFSVENEKSTKDDYQCLSDIPNDVNQYDSLQSKTISKSE